VRSFYALLCLLSKVAAFLAPARSPHWWGTPFDPHTYEQTNQNQNNNKYSCAPEDLERERGPVLEERRLGRGAGGRAQEAYWRLALEGSKCAGFAL
jgi:hypothetical protein